MKDINKFIEEVFNKRYTCKGYDSEKQVSDEDFRTIIEAGRLSPSSFGFEPWKFILLKNRDVLEEIKPYAWGAHASIEGASHFVLILARTPKHMKPGSEYLRHIKSDIQKWPDDLLKQRSKKYGEFSDDDFDLNSDRAVFDWTTKQVYIPLANMLTTAAMLGVDSTPMEGFHQEKVNEVLVKNGVYDKEDFRLAVMVAFGYSNREHREKTRREVDEVFEVFE
ncbi:NAD(P)H-dependent oxidoreductase [Microaceticoccus formicicus]|uniref:NAD(P)H-dependent oxidoreductase n=1 Tax=Microaceticoccus formicicus TaxID=3118105 RepID=UPI003CD0323E|nr:NAD(P)H-dependent oxidoreductase [Peptoniphilaceae bacterium AMB_02]